MISKIKTKIAKKNRKLKPWIISFIPVFVSILTTLIIALNLLSTVAVQRGYFAFGGEWFLLIGIFYSIYVVVDVVIDVYFV